MAFRGISAIRPLPPAPGPPGPGPSAPVSPRWRDPAARAVRAAAALAGLAAIAGFAFVALSRLGYPFEVEWLESNSLVEVHRVLAGQPLYAAPSAGYVPDGYPPLYFAVSAAVAAVSGVSYLPLRLVSLVSALVCFGLLGRLVQRETSSAAAGTAAAGLFAGTYFVTRTWFDAGRVDSLFLALSLGGLYAAWRMRGTRGAVAAGVLLAAAALTKQTGFAEAVMVPGVLLGGPRRRLAWIALASAAAVTGVTTLILGAASHGWYVYYVFELMSQHSLSPGAAGVFAVSVLTALGLALPAAVSGVRRVPPEVLAGCAAMIIEGFAALAHSGGGVNDVLPAYLAVALLAGLALGTPNGWRTAAAGGLVLAQTVLLLTSMHPSRAIPAGADRAAGTRVLAGMKALGGTVADPTDPALGPQAGLPAVAHADAAGDVLRAANRAAIARYRASVASDIAGRRFSAVISEHPGPPSGYPPVLLNRYYQECPQPLLAGAPASAFRPVDGIRFRPARLWLPRGRGSCAAAVQGFNTPGGSRTSPDRQARR